jgi:hypothetical protein
MEGRATLFFLADAEAEHWLDATTRRWPRREYPGFAQRSDFVLSLVSETSTPIAIGMLTD